MSEQAARVIAECRAIAAMSEEQGRITRRFLTAPVRDVHRHLRSRMEALGMAVHVDAAGNLRGLWLSAETDSSTQRLVMGSHIDTVPDAGAFDGVLGVAMALEWVEIARELALPFAMEVIAFSEEEGVRFGVPFIGSRAVAGRFDSSLLALKDAEGFTLRDAMHTFELEPERIGEAALNGDVLGFVEVHIEQGPVLDAAGHSVAAVTGIVGQSRLSLKFTGHANHAGTTPMRLRQDALAGAAEWIGAVERLAQRTEGLVATVGKISVEPNAGNVVAGTAQLSLDVRHISDQIRTDVVDTLLTSADKIALRRGLHLEYARQLDQAAVPMDERLTAFMCEAVQTAGYPPMALSSGAGHDAMVMAARVPTTMLFLRSPGGISHHPSETVLLEDVEAALQVGRKFLERIAAEVM